MPAPVAKLTGMSLWEPNEPFLKRHREILDKVRVGDSWVIMTGGETTIHCKIEKFAVATMACQAGIAAICSVASDEQAALKDVREKYYLALPQSEFTRKKGQPPASRVGFLKEGSKMDAPAKERLEAVLHKQMLQELARVRREMVDEYSRNAAQRWAREWKTYDERLARGEGKLSYDVQALRLTPDGQPRLYVRAQWTWGSKVVFLTTLWIRPDQQMQIEAVSSKEAELLRMSEFQHMMLGLKNLGMILNVFDWDGNGWGEILMTQEGYESFGIGLLEYSERGPQATGIAYGYGC